MLLSVLFAVQLSSIDTLLQTRPDSALTLLLDGPMDEPYYQLLLSEALYKNDYQQANREDLLDAVAYFDSIGDPFLAARAHYINGVGYYEMDSVVPACAEYLKALEIMETHFKEKELVGYKAKFMALTYTRLTSLFSNLYLHDQTIFFATRSLPYYQKQRDETWFVSWVLNQIGSHYEMKGQLDSALFYYQRAALSLVDTCCVLYRDITTHQIYLNYKTNKQFDVAVKLLHQMLSQADNSKERTSRFLTIGELFYREQLFDSAWCYLNQVYQEPMNLSSKKQAAEWLVDICKEQGKLSELLDYANFLVPYANQEENQSSIKSQISEQYNSFRQQEITRKHQIMVKNSMIHTMILVGFLLFLVVAILFIYLKRKRSFKTQLEAESYAHNTKQKALSKRLKTTNDALRKTLQRLEKHETERDMAKNVSSSCLSPGDYQVFIHTKICQEIFASIDKLHADNRKTLKTNINFSEYKDFSLSLTQLSALIKAVETCFPYLYPKLKTMYGNLDRNDWLHCCLYLMQLDKMSICVLLQEPYYSCRRYTLKLEKAFNCRLGLSAFLLDNAINC